MSRVYIKKAPVEITCAYCSATFRVPYKQRARRFCNHSCAFKGTRRESNAELSRRTAEKRGDAMRGTGSGNGYVKRGGRHEHRTVMEAILGRRLLPGEIVHHSDEIKSNNSRTNLALTNRPDHARLHNLGRKRIPKTVCKNGHFFTPENTRITSIGRRQCRTCERAYQRQWKRDRRREQGLVK